MQVRAQHTRAERGKVALQRRCAQQKLNPKEIHRL
jgi:hypothetical protein